MLVLGSQKIDAEISALSSLLVGGGEIGPGLREAPVKVLGRSFGRALGPWRIALSSRAVYTEFSRGLDQSSVEIKVVLFLYLSIEVANHVG